jgi:hypothetical protein
MTCRTLERKHAKWLTFKEIGPRRRDMMMWIASDLTRDAEHLLQEVAPQVLRGPGALSSPGAA